jgi:hypothetical protein
MSQWKKLMTRNCFLYFFLSLHIVSCAEDFHKPVVVLDSPYITVRISTEKGARAVFFSVFGRKNMAHPVYGFFSDHPTVENWEAFRFHPYTLESLEGSLRASFVGKKDGLEISKVIELSTDSPMLTVRYKIYNRGEKPVTLNSAFADFFKVPDESGSFATSFVRDSGGGIIGRANSAASSYKKVSFTNNFAEDLHAYFPDQNVDVIITPSRGALSQLCLSCSSGQYFGMETFLDPREIQKNGFMEFSKKYEFRPDPVLGPQVQDYINDTSERIQKKKLELKKVVTPPYPGQQLGITGAFYSFWNVGPLINQDKALADREMRAMKEAGMDTVIIETGFSSGLIYPSKHYKTMDGVENVLEFLVQAAEETGLKIILSIPFLHHNPFLMGQEELDEVKNRSILFLEELYEKYGQSPAFSGWYTGFEISDTMISEATERLRIAGFYRDITEQCHRLTPDLPVSIAPYFFADIPADEFERIWYEFLDYTNLDVFMIQDSVGAIYVSKDVEERFKLLPNYYLALHRACQKAGVEFWSDLEVFEQAHGSGVDDKELSLIPARFERVQRQLELEQEFVKKIVVYEFANYMSPNGFIKTNESRSRDLYERYLEYQSNR